MKAKYLILGIAFIFIIECGKDTQIIKSGNNSKADSFQQIPIPMSLNKTNPHYFTFRSKPTILFTSGEHYGALINTAFDYTTYFQTLAADSLNNSRVFMGLYHETADSHPDIISNTLAPDLQHYICPWRRDPTAALGIDGGRKFDLTKWNPAYFSRMHSIIQAASRKGITLEITLFSVQYDNRQWNVCPLNIGNNINNVGNCSGANSTTIDKSDGLYPYEKAYTEKIVQELRYYDNVFFEIINEPWYFDGANLNDVYVFQDEVIGWIVNKEAGLAADRRHLISQDCLQSDPNYLSRINPVTSVVNFHYAQPQDINTTLLNLNIAIGDNETGGEGYEDKNYRRQAWNFILAGGALYNNLDWSFAAGGFENGNQAAGAGSGYNLYGGGGSPNLRFQLRILREFMKSFNFIKMKPDNSVLGNNSAGKAQVLAEAGQAYAIFISSEESFLEIQLPAGNYHSVWVDTKTGGIIKSENFISDSNYMQLLPPAYSEDIALSIRRRVTL